MLRRDKSGAGWCIFGDIYVNGFMEGRAVEKNGRLVEKFDIF